MGRGLIWLGIFTGGCASPCERGAFAWADDGRELLSAVPVAQAFEFDGDLVLTVCPGNWEGTLAVEGRGGRLSIEALNSDATLDAAGGPGVLIATGTGTLTVRNLTLRGGLANDEESGRTCGGALYAGLPSTVLEGVTLEANHAWLGGAICVGEGSSVLVKESVVTGNTAGGGGGAVLMAPGAQIASFATDWGEADADNTPDDIALFGPGLEVLGQYWFGRDADFLCSLDDGACD